MSDAEPTIRLGRILGIEIRLHYSGLIIALFLSALLAGHFGEKHPSWAPTVAWQLAVTTVLLFFAATMLHEFSHVAVARSWGFAIRSITLFAPGCVPRVGNRIRDAGTEFWIDIAGPITSALIGSVCLALPLLLGSTFLAEPATPLTSMLVALGYINIGFTVFTLVPVSPMDGGRVLWVVLWWMTGDIDRATRVVAGASRVIGLGFILVGIFRLVSEASIGGLWIIVGLYLLSGTTGFRTSGDHLDNRNV